MNHLSLTKSFCRQFFSALPAAGLALLAPLASAAPVGPEISYKAGGPALELKVPTGGLLLDAVSPDVIRLRFAPPGVASKYESVTMVNRLPAKTTLREEGSELFFSTGNVTVAADKTTGRVRFLDASGREVLAEAADGRKFTKATVTGEDSWTPEQTFVSPAGESLYGLGQHQDGRLDWRGETLRLWQANTEISVPFVWSTAGYGILWDNPSDTWFNPGEPVALSGNRGTLRVPEAGEYSLWLNHASGAGCWDGQNVVKLDGKPVIELRNKWVPYGSGASVKLEANRDYAVEVAGQGALELMVHKKTPTTTWRSKVGEAVDYYFVAGATPGRVIANYRALSGHVPLLPKYAWGYWQCRERYGSSKQLIEAVDGFRKRGIPVDIIVQDWQYWGKYGWNAMKWDEGHYPDVPALTKTLHKKNTRLVVSVWSKFDRKTDVFQDLAKAGGIVGNSEWFDPTNPKAREIYWQHSKKGHFDQGVDGYWQDATEPESDCLLGATLHLGTGDRYLNAYPMFVNQAVYEGNRAASNGTKRLCDLTRSGYAGMQRYGTISWSGDIKGSWEAFQRQIPAGLGFTSAGLPYWTTDIGGFFRPGSPCGPKGNQYTSPDFRELLCRWLQCGTFFPIQRMHGFVSHTEPWNYGPEAEAVLVKYLKLRYRFLPYIYSTAWHVHQGGSMMKPLAMDFPGEPALRDIKDEFLFGDALLVAPIVEPRAKTGGETGPAVKGPEMTATIPLAADSGPKPAAGSDGGQAFTSTEPSVRQVVLPAGAKWYDFWSGKPAGEGTITVSAPIDVIPLFVRAGTILPFGPDLQHTGEKTTGPLEIRIYPGADAQFTLYDDAGEGYSYEKGERSLVSMRWNDRARELTIGAREGAFPGMAPARDFRVVLVGSPEKPVTVHYTGQKTRLGLK